MLSIQTIQPDTLELLKRLSNHDELRETRLVGGTALALLYGHRQSIDLDFFGHLPNDKEELIAIASQEGKTTVLNRTNYILQMIINGVKVDFVDYSRYPWIDEPVQSDGFILASDKDIAALKVNAIMGRGTRKDFVDIYVLLQHFSLEEILSFYKQKYPENSEYRALRSLTYFEDAEMQDMPTMLFNTSWNDMKKAIIKAVCDYQK